MKNLINLCFALFIGQITACDDILEIDISNENVIIISPLNGTQLEQREIVFWWEKLEGALEYHISVVSPSFGSVSSVKLDSTINENLILLQLEPGVYEWRIRAKNKGYYTDYQWNSFTVK